MDGDPGTKQICMDNFVLKLIPLRMPQRLSRWNRNSWVKAGCGTKIPEAPGGPTAGASESWLVLFEMRQLNLHVKGNRSGWFRMFSHYNVMSFSSRGWEREPIGRSWAARWWRWDPCWDRKKSRMSCWPCLINLIRSTQILKPSVHIRYSKQSVQTCSDQRRDALSTKLKHSIIVESGSQASFSFRQSQLSSMLNSEILSFCASKVSEQSTARVHRMWSWQEP